MTKITSKRFVHVSLTALTSLMLILQISTMSIGSTTATAAPQIADSPLKIPDYVMTADQKDTIMKTAMNHPGLKNLSTTGWKFVTMDYYGTLSPKFEYTSVVLHFVLPPEVKTRLNCDKLGATVEVDLKTYQIKDAYVPDEKVDCNGSIELGKAVYSQQIVDIPTFIPTASAVTSTNGLLAAMQNDVSTPTYGGWVRLTTPNINTSIYGHMNQFVAHLFNQYFGGSNFLQLGWLSTRVQGCASCNVQANSTILVYVDQNAYGDTEARKIQSADGITYTPNSVDYVQILCDGSGSNYKMQATVNSHFFVRTTGIPCGTGTINDPANNSVFFENKNTVPSSNWASDITTAVQAFGAQEYNTPSSFKNWSSSSNKYQTCGINAQWGDAGSTMTGNLAGGGTATWAILSNTPKC